MEHSGPVTAPCQRPLHLEFPPRIADSFLAAASLRHGGKGQRGSTLRVALLLSTLAVVGSSSLSAQGSTECIAKIAPAAAFTATCSNLACSFTIFSGSPPSGISDLEWDFGDGSSGAGPPGSIPPPQQLHTYAVGGYYLVTLAVTDGDGQVAVAIGGVNLAGGALQLAVDDAFSTDLGTRLAIAYQELLSNDAPGVRFASVDGNKCFPDPSGASCSYVPSAAGLDSFQYSVRDAAGNPGSAWVRVTVTQPPPTANPDYFETTTNLPINITSKQLLENDSAGAVFVHPPENPDHGEPGTPILLGTNPTDGYVYSFAPKIGYTGLASFEYLISWDGNPPFERGFVSIDVKDGPPTAGFVVACGPDSLHPQDSFRTCRVHPTSTDVEGLARWLWNWGDGSAPIEPTTPYPWAEQTHTYSASGRYTITHTVYDTAGQSSSLQIDVLPNTRPIAADDLATTDRDVAQTIAVLANDSDPDGDPLTINSVTLQQPGAAYQVVPNGRSWAVRITPPDSFTGTMTFPYLISDPWGAAATATVTLNVTQWTYVVDALGEQLYTPQNTVLRISKAAVLGNDYHEDPAATLSIDSYDTSILMGSLDCASVPTECKYTPPLGGAGFTLFKYKACDAARHCDTATVRIYVAGRGSSPTAADDYFVIARDTSKASAFTIQQLVQNDYDADGDTLSVGLLSGARDFGSVVCSTPMYICNYAAGAGFVGTDRFPYTATDVMNPPVTANINVLTLPPSVPTFDAREDFRATAVNQQTYIGFSGLASNDYDPEGDPITASSTDVTGLIGGSLNSCDSFGCMFKPNSSFQGTARFKYTATDGHGSTDTAFVKIRVGGTNTAPVALPDSLSTPKNSILRFSVFELLRNDYDVDNDPLTPIVYPATTAKGTVACDAKTYWCTYAPKLNVTGADTVNYALSDGTTAVSSTFTVTILP